jgi:hypothetical protein
MGNASGSRGPAHLGQIRLVQAAQPDRPTGLFDVMPEGGDGLGKVPVHKIDPVEFQDDPPGHARLKQLSHRADRFATARLRQPDKQPIRASLDGESIRLLRMHLPFLSCRIHGILLRIPCATTMPPTPAQKRTDRDRRSARLADRTRPAILDS